MDEQVTQTNDVSQQGTVDGGNNYIEAIKEMRKNTVDKKDYEKLQEENKQLLQTLIEGGQIEQTVEKEPVDLDQLRDDLFNHDNTNLDYIKKALELRDELLKAGQVDPFLPVGHNIAASDSDYATAEKVANALKSCVEYADGNSDIFTQELQRITVDSMPMAGRRRK